jgi:hypothetical protein
LDGIEQGKASLKKGKHLLCKMELLRLAELSLEKHAD